MSTPRWPLFLIAGVWSLTAAFNCRLLPARNAHEISVESLKLAPLPLVVRAPGTLEPKRSVTFKAEFDGPVVSRNFEEGKPVKEGQLLIEIGRDHIRMDYQTKSDALTNARADLKKAQKDEGLQESLYVRQAVSLSSVEDAQRAVQRARQALASAQEAFKLERDTWNKNKFQAPFDGILFKDFLQNDNSVSAGKEVLTVADLSGYIVDARVDELDIGRVKEGQTAEVRLPTYEHTVLSAHVTQIGAQPQDKGSTEIPVSLSLDSTQNLPLRALLTADVRIQTGETAPAVSAPLAAIDNRTGEPAVWVLRDTGRLHRQPATLGKANPDRVEITVGLLEGEQIATSVEPYYQEGLKVRARE